MANSKKPLASSTVSHAVSVRPQIVLQLHTFLKNHLKPDQRLLLALSGGLDSTVLLHLLVEAKRTIPFELYAMHVHHGLSKNADSWASFCEQQCQQLQVPWQVMHVNVDKDSGSGIEGAARQLRYEALFGYKLNETYPDFIVTAHHQDDQAETLLLQLFRGAGVKGLASMAAVDNARRLLRPLLDVSRKELESYAMQHAIHWCEDESNDDTHYERNFVRHEVMPVLESRYPAVKSVIARTASHLSEANELLDSLAAMDVEELVRENSLCLQGLAKLDASRAKNGLRWWFARNQLAMPSAEQLSEMYSQLMNAKPDANLSIEVQSKDYAQTLSIKRFQQRAYLCRNQPVQAFDLVWNGEPELVLPNGGKLLFRQVNGTGLAVKFGMTRLRITNRDGGERFKPNALRPTRTLKHLLQEAHIPPWQREQLPLIYWQDTLAYVPGVGVAHELQATGQELGIEIIWHEAPI
jgi:tRNA(Ile)-lysidine synthase